MVLMMAIVVLYPIVKTVGMSFFENYLARPGMNPFVGLKHYLNFFDNKYFVNSIIITIKYVVITVLLRFVIGLIAALLLNEKVKMCIRDRYVEAPHKKAFDLLKEAYELQNPNVEIVYYGPAYDLSLIHI